jgi:hypothetical protein
MASLHAAVALTALADVDVELSVDRLAWDLDLELLSDVSFVEGSAAVRTDVGQGRLVDLVDLFGGRWLAVRLGAIVFARLAAGFARIELGLALGEGSSLAFAGTKSGFELIPESFVLSLEIVYPSLTCVSHLLGHTGSLAKAPCVLSLDCPVLERPASLGERT